MTERFSKSQKYYYDFFSFLIMLIKINVNKFMPSNYAKYKKSISFKYKVF